MTVRQSVHPSVWALAVAMLAIEALFSVADAGFAPGLRYAVFERLAVGSVPPQIALQVPEALPWFLAGLIGYAFLHAGWLHVIFNTVGLLCLGHVVQAQAGTLAFLGVFAGTAVAGAIMFLAVPGHGIVVGASGAVFGLLAVVLRWRTRRIALWRVLVVLALVSLPAGLIVPGPVAWQAHLGGFLAGWLFAPALPIRRRILHPLM